LIKIPARKVVARGPRGEILCAVAKNGRMEAEEFLNSPQCKNAKPSLLALFQVIVNANPHDVEIGPKPLKGTKICEFKKGQVRLFCFRDGDAWVLTHGDLKKSDQTPPAHIERAERIRREDMEIAAKRN
jgi:hypothetical protein